jgi:hypothetical protein
VRARRLANALAARGQTRLAIPPLARNGNPDDHPEVDPRLFEGYPGRDEEG